MGSGQSVMRAETSAHSTSTSLITSAGGRRPMTEQALQQIGRTYQRSCQRKILHYWRTCCEHLYLSILSNGAMQQQHLDSFAQMCALNPPIDQFNGRHTYDGSSLAIEVLAYCRAEADPLTFMQVRDAPWPQMLARSWRWPGDLWTMWHQRNAHSRFSVIEVSSQQRVTLDLVLHENYAGFAMHVAFATETTVDMRDLDWIAVHVDPERDNDSEYSGDYVEQMESIVVEADTALIRVVFVAVHSGNVNGQEFHLVRQSPRDMLLSEYAATPPQPVDVIYTLVLADRQQAREQATLVTWHWRLVLEFAMGSHWRVGGQSIVRLLEPDVLRMIAMSALYTTDGVNEGLLRALSSMQITSGQPSS